MNLMINCPQELKPENKPDKLKSHSLKEVCSNQGHIGERSDLRQNIHNSVMLKPDQSRETLQESTFK